MEKQIICIISKDGLKEVILEIIQECDKIITPTSFEKDRLNRKQAEILADMCSPTFRKMVLSGVFPEHGSGRKKFYLKSEILSGLKKNADRKIF